MAGIRSRELGEVEKNEPYVSPRLLKAASLSLLRAEVGVNIVVVEEQVKARPLRSLPRDMLSHVYY